MRVCIACAIKGDKEEYEVEDLISDDDTTIKCEGPNHKELEQT